MLQKDNTYKTYTYKEVHKKALRVAYFLRRKKLEPQACIGIYASNSPEWAIICLGILLNNNIVVPIDPKNGSVELSHIIKDARIDYVFVAPRLSQNLDGLDVKNLIIIGKQQDLTQLKTKNIYILDDIFNQQGFAELLFPALPDDVTTIIYTSGTTSEPKGVMLTHHGILFDIGAILKVFPVDQTDNFLSVIVLSHSYELCCGLFLPFFIGASVTYCSSLKYTTIFRNMTLSKPTVMYAVPELFRLLLDTILRKVASPGILEQDDVFYEKNPQVESEAAQKAQQLLGGNIRFFVSGGAPLAKSVISGFKGLKIPLLQVYGLTECSPVLTMTPPDNEKVGSVGKPLPGIEIRIEKQHGSEIGEIWARGENLMKGYHNNPKSTGQTIKGGWLNTGDLGCFDDQNWLYITGRSKNIIVTSAGVNVFPEEIEDQIIKSPFIEEVCVIGMQKPDMTETVYAVVVVKDRHYKKFIRQQKLAGVKDIPPLTDIIRREIDRCNQHLADFKRVLGFKISSRKLPQGRTNKILRNEVRRQAFSMDGRFVQQPNAEHAPPIALINATIITPFRIVCDECILIENGKISQLAAKDKVFLPPNIKVIDLDGMIITPSFVDLHVHGAVGCSFNTPNESALSAISKFYLAHGTTLLLATLYLDERKKLIKTIRYLARHCKQNHTESIIYGMHLEGPFINKNMKGALNEDYILEPSIDEWFKLRKAGMGFIKMMTIATELPGSFDVMQFAAQDNVVLSIAHSQARYEDIEVAIDNGLSQVTHIFNAMSPVHHRKPGILTGALLKRELKVHLIADGIHVHPAVMQLLYKLKGPEGIILISDAISATGTESNVFEMAGKKVMIQDGIALLDDNTLAGSTITLEKAIKVMVKKVGIPITEAVRMASLNPARVLGLDHKKGILAVGKDADLVVMNKDFDVQMTIVNGQIRYSKT